MSHTRERYITRILLKRLKIAPVVAIQGARQTGKSFLVRELLKHRLPKFHYVTLDKKTDRVFAEKNPETFLSQHNEKVPLVIDEAQKAPSLFDAIKAQVDQERRPGQMILLGSTEFSTLHKIRESLTGRMSRVRIHPMTLAESRKEDFCDWSFSEKSFLQPKVSRAELLRFLDRGGMPGIFAVRENEFREQLLKDWLDLTVNRDLMQVPKLKLDAEIGMEILRCVATLEEPTAGAIAKTLKIDPRRIATHVKALKTLFVLNSIAPLRGSTGKEILFLLDPAFVGIFGGDFRRRLQTWLLNEILVRNSVRSRPWRVCFYRTSKGRFIDFVLEEEQDLIALQIFDSETTYDRDLNLLRSFGQKHKGAKLFGLSGGVQNLTNEKIFIRPWENMG